TDQRLGGARVEDGCLEAARLAARSLARGGGLAGAFLIARVGEGDARSLGGKHLAQRPSQAARGAGDENAFALQESHGAPLREAATRSGARSERAPLRVAASRAV